MQQLELVATLKPAPKRTIRAGDMSGIHVGIHVVVLSLQCRLREVSETLKETRFKNLILMRDITVVTIIRLKETPKYLLGQGKDAEVAETLQWMATKYGRQTSITTEVLEACGQIKGSKEKGFSLSTTMVHFRGLFLTKKLGFSTCLIWLSWTLIGLAYPLYNVFLRTYPVPVLISFSNSSEYCLSLL
jgi:hypothetical protein